jgi:hypothetical protein
VIASNDREPPLTSTVHANAGGNYFAPPMVSAEAVRCQSPGKAYSVAGYDAHSIGGAEARTNGQPG